MLLLRPLFLIVLSLCLLANVHGNRLSPRKTRHHGDGFNAKLHHFVEAPTYRNQQNCPLVDRSRLLLECDPSQVHVAMTMDREYLRGTVAAVNSILKHASCPENIFFHFIASDSRWTNRDRFAKIVRSIFTSLSFKMYLFKESVVNTLISSSVRHALENPLNYARTYLADMLEPCIERVIYLDSDVIVVDGIHKLWQISLTGSRVIAAPQYCHANFSRYFSQKFWSSPEFSRTFAEKRPCYFNTGVMVMDLVKWRKGDYKRKIEKWMEVQKGSRIYDLGSLPPFLLVFGGDVEAIERRWNQHGLGGDNVIKSCRSIHPGPVSLLHWSGKGKPWARLDANQPCPVDHLWAHYDLYETHNHACGHYCRKRRQSRHRKSTRKTVD